MPKMPRGEPRSTVDPADQELARRRKSRGPIPTPLDLLEDFQNGPKIARPNLVESFIPVVGPAWEAAADLQDGNYGGAAFNGAMAVADLLPIGVAAKGARYASKGVWALKTTGSVSADAVRKTITRRGLKKAGQELHHTIPLEGLGRNVQDWRNHPMFLKQLPIEQHRRLTGSWAGKPMYDPVRKIWYGTTDWQKVAPTMVAADVADAVESRVRREASPPKRR